MDCEVNLDFLPSHEGDSVMRDSAIIAMLDGGF
jgi:hypothetical protein